MKNYNENKTKKGVARNEDVAYDSRSGSCPACGYNQTVDRYDRITTCRNSKCKATIYWNQR